MIRNWIRQIRCLGDETRLRMVQLLLLEEVTVSELAEAMNIGQSRVSTLLRILREAGLVRERKEGKKTFVRLERSDESVHALLEFLRPKMASLPQSRLDAQNLTEVIRRRELADQLVAPRGLGKSYLPGRTWEGLARTLLRLLTFERVLDIGVGDGDLTLLLAARARRLTGIDPDENCLQKLRTRVDKARMRHVTLKSGDIEHVPEADATFDLVFASQVLHHALSPEAAVEECVRVLKPGATLVVLDLKSHAESWVRDRLGHTWQGFEPARLSQWFKRAGLVEVKVEPVAKDQKPPRFITVAATGRKP